MTDNLLSKYSEVILKTGLNLKRDQCLLISCGIDHYDFALKTAEIAYKMGARYVEIAVQGTKLTRLRANNSQKGFLNFIPNYLTVKSSEFVADNWAQLRLDYTEEIDQLADADITALDTISKAERTASKILNQEMIGFRKRWCIVAVPGPKWAAKIFGATSKENEAKLDAVIEKIMRLDNDDPAEVWRKHGIRLSERADKLRDMDLDTIRFTGKGTDLEIGLIKGAAWKGGINKTLDGIEFIPNLPTEEVFTTPDFRRTNGMAKVTRPVKVLEKTVEGAWFEFKEGKVVKFGADKNTEALEKFLDTDEGSVYLGEAALVDSSSPIFESGLVFNSILYDENAACHIAIGKGFASVLPGNEVLTDEDEMRKRGCNVSLIHTDFMIGHESINVTGKTSAGKQMEIITNGKFVI
jgi:aminopeptidase